MTYRTELTRAMTLLGQDPRTIFMGQAVAFPGTGMSATFGGVHYGQLLEMPVAEDMQMGMAIGMSLNGFLPVCVYPRINFLILALNQLVLHLDKLPIYGNGYKPKVIVRTAVASNQPMDPGAQHLGDFTEALESILDTIKVVHFWKSMHIVPEYQKAMDRVESTLLVERTDLYDKD